MCSGQKGKYAWEREVGMVLGLTGGHFYRSFGAWLICVSVVNCILVKITSSLWDFVHPDSKPLVISLAHLFISSCTFSTRVTHLCYRCSNLKAKVKPVSTLSIRLVDQLAWESVGGNSFLILLLNIKLTKIKSFHLRVFKQNLNKTQKIGTGKSHKFSG